MGGDGGGRWGDRYFLIILTMCYIHTIKHHNYIQPENAYQSALTTLTEMNVYLIVILAI